MSASDEVTISLAYYANFGLAHAIRGEMPQTGQRQLGVVTS